MNALKIIATIWLSTFSFDVFAADPMFQTAVFKPNCASSPRTDTYADLRHFASTKGEDDRGPLGVLGPKHGLSARGYHNAMKTVGDCFCPGDGVVRNYKGPKGRVERRTNMSKNTCFIAGDKSTVTTADHTFFDEAARQRRIQSNPKLANCTFTNKLGETAELDFSSIVSPTTNPTKNPNLDRAHVRIKMLPDGSHPIKDFEPLEIALGKVQAGEEQIGITSSEEDYAGDSSDLIFRTFNVSQVQGNLNINDADVSNGGSGGANGVIRNGHIVVTGIFIRSSDWKTMNGKEFNDQTTDPDKKNIAISLSFDKAALKDISSLAGKDVQAASLQDSKASSGFDL